eukprot:PITA_05937
MRAPPAPLHPIIVVGPFSKWGIDFITCNPHSVGGHGYIILAVDYFTKWAEAIPTYRDDDETATIFIFNHVIAQFGVPQAIVIDHGNHFHNFMMVELPAQIVLRHDSSTSYYPQANALWAYCTTVKTSTGFTPFQLVYGLEVVLPIECEIASLKLAIELLHATSMDEERFVHLAHLDENLRDVVLASKAHQKCFKDEYDQNVNPRSHSEGDLVLVYDQAHEKLGAGKFEPMWHGPYIIKHVLAKVAYELVDYDGIPLGKPINGLYLKKYFA